MFPVDPALESALSDPLFMLRLYKRVAYGLAPRPRRDGARTFLPSFLSVDARYVESKNAVMDAVALPAAVEPIFPMSLLTREEVCLLLRVLPLEEEETTAGHAESEGAFGEAQRRRRSSGAKGIRPGSVMQALRDIVPFRTWQVWQTVAAARRMVQGSPVMSPFEEHLVDVLDWQASPHRQAAEADPPPLERREALAFMEHTCALSSSESHGLLDYCACGEGNGGGGGATAASYLGCEPRLLHQLLFSEVIPGVAEYPLLMGRFAEATLEIGETESYHTGTLALQTTLELLELRYPEHSRRLSSDLDMGTLVRAELTPRKFFYVCTYLRTGFRQEESDQLYYYLKKDSETEDGVLVADLLAAYRQYFPSITVSMVQLVQAAVTQWLRRNAKDAPAFVQLYSALREWGTARVPIKAFIEALRVAGVPNGISGVLDVELEWLRLKAPTRVDLLLMLCTPVPPSRAAVTRKLFDRLDEHRSDTVTCAAVLRRFNPELIDGNAARRQGALWKKALEEYVAELGEGELDYDVFAYFWYMVSAGVEDDPTFTLALWKAFGLSDDGRRPRRT
ncbi:hypothetical protein GH5_07171 [Leishmania sp. Ghana 2012 LV757]|uniref:hypothetical protein n=1 Tax=Leishmania sp. Ghana 2012 LV757 TaxID=2803181 RepID=UPI001B5E524A|nr:hypothetical protein GH5_07171 [Leishmania sp. Ghana 2012 LV757]